MQSTAITSRNRAPPKSLALIPSPATIDGRIAIDVRTSIDGRTVFGHPICKRLRRNAIIAAS